MYLSSSSGKRSSLEVCKTSCEEVMGCQSITYFKSKWCSHFSTECTRTRWSFKAVAIRLSSPSDDAVGVGASDREDNHPSTWVDVGSKIACDSNAGEELMSSSRGSVANTEGCQELCLAEVECKSITFFTSGWCSLFSTSCTNTARSNKATAMRVIPP